MFQYINALQLMQLHLVHFQLQ